MDPPTRPSVTVLANPDCPHCAHATDTLTGWAEEVGATVAGIDLKQHPDLAQRWHVEESPSVIVEDGRGAPRVHAGMPTHDEFVRMASE